MNVHHVITAILFAIGLLFLIIGMCGLFNNRYQALIAFDQWIACCLLPDSFADETISAWAHRKHHKRLERFINWLFKDPNHCATAYVSEMNGVQNASIYSKEQ